MTMPGADGVALSKTLSATQSGVRCILMSGYSQDRDSPETAASGVVAFLQKPFTPTQLLKKVQEVLG
jgi:FixJ family two-component response regulator